MFLHSFVIFVSFVVKFPVMATADDVYDRKTITHTASTKCQYQEIISMCLEELKSRHHQKAQPKNQSK